jgi:hypothetical protein
VLGLLKNLFFTALMVIGATMATAVVICVVMILMASQGATAPIDPGMGASVLSLGIIGALLLGFFFSFASLFVAALTMPPAIWLIRWFKLPRPLFDIFGGGAAGLICAAAFLGLLKSIEQAKGGNLTSDIQPALEICGMLGGAALGYLRHAVLVRPKDPAPQVEATAGVPLVS